MPKRTSNPAYLKARKQILTGNPPCHWCGKPATEADHLIEHDRGGTDTPENLVPSCKPCNSRRGQLYKAKRDAIIKSRRENAINTHKTPFFTETDPPPTLSFSLSFDQNQPEPAATSGNRLELVPTDHNQPRLETPHLGGSTYGPSIAAWAAEHLNIELMPWQIHALSGQLLHDENGNLVFRESLVSTARQQGKSVALRALIGWWLTEYTAIRGEAQIVLSTANKLDRAEAIFTDLAFVLKEHYDAKLMQALGRKSVTMPSGSRWEVRAASPALHGGSYDLIVVDELWNISAAVIDEALRPSQIARPAPLLSMWSTAGDEGSHSMIQYRENALAEIDRGEVSLSYFAEWSMPPSCDPRDEASWAWANPALGRTVTIQALRAASKKDSFARAHLNLWQAARGAWLDRGDWDEWATTEPMPDGGVLAVDSSVDDARYVGVRTAVKDGRIHTLVEFVVDTEQGMWDEIERVMSCKTTRLAITPTLEIHLPTKYAARYNLVGYGELLKYTTLARSMILEGRVTHRGQRNLDEHMYRAVMKKTAQGAVLSSQASPGPIELARCAVWAIALVSRPVNSQKPMIVVAR